MPRCLTTMVVAAVLASPQAQAYLALHPTNPRYFLETTTGEAVLIASHGNIAPTSRGIDYVAEIARNAGHGMRYARVWHWLPWEEENALWPWWVYSIGSVWSERSKTSLSPS